MRDFAEAGGAILFHSTEIPELVHLCDRVLVLYDGRVAAELDGEAIDGAGDHARRPSAHGHAPARCAA